MEAGWLQVQLGCIEQGLLQHLALNYTAQAWHCFRSWLRTTNPTLLLSELLVSMALRRTLPGFSAFAQIDPNPKKIRDTCSDSTIGSNVEVLAA